MPSPSTVKNGLEARIAAQPRHGRCRSIHAYHNWRAKPSKRCDFSARCQGGNPPQGALKIFERLI
jgi:hypothetical protein